MGAEDADMPSICAALRAEVEASSESIRSIAKRAEVSYSLLQRWMSGQEPRLANVRRLEEVLAPNAAKGWLLRRAGYVDEPTTLEDVLLGTPLSRHDRNTVVSMVEGLIRAGEQS